MSQSLQEYAKFYSSKHKSRRIFRKFLRVMACVVAFATTYALILPAITLEKPTFCGEDEHTHSEACYLLQTESREYACSIESELHVHDTTCYHENGSVICGMADYVIHSHGSECRNPDGELLCSLPERTQHTHNEACYVIPEPIIHAHSDSCMVETMGDLICPQEISEGHKHTDSCYQTTDQLQCTKVADHQHGDDCYDLPLICTLSTDPHSHGDDCYDIGELICNIPENHVHQDSCMDKFLSCSETESEHVHDENCQQDCTEGHLHADSCYSTGIVCTTQEGHIHDQSCYESSLNCGKEEGAVHDHTESCYSSEKLLNCTLDENHVHDDSCYAKELSCEQAENEGHTHSDTCYEWLEECGCGMEEGQTEPIQEQLVCTEPAAITHVHDDSCFRIKQVPAEPVCTEDHEHTYTCYQKICEQSEHTHSLQCYSDPNADVESRRQWESTVKNVELTGDWSLDLIAIAESQLGYQESTRNYEVSKDGTIHGYTRYGDWYGIPHGDWCAMFASFCMRYAGIDTVPIHSGVRPWIEKLSEPEIDLYRTAEEYTPVPGDLVFFDWDGDERSDHVGIVYEIIEATENKQAKLKTIEGNSSNRVQFVKYDLDSPDLLGYGMLPEDPDMNYSCGREKHVHSKRDCYEEANLICDQNMHIHGKGCTVQQPAAPEKLTYYCNLEAHEHSEACYDAEGNPICQQIWHQHEDTCLIEPVTEPAPEPAYYCGMEVHIHEETCHDEAGEVVCEQPVHEHSDECLIEPVPEPTPDLVYYCGMEVHMHEETCHDEAGEVVCEILEHEHNEACLIEAVPEPAPEPAYYCGMEVHMHEETCHDEAGEVVCEQPVHEHSDECLIEPVPETILEPTYYCGMEVHIHEETCFEADTHLVCEKPEHTHEDRCTWIPMLAPPKVTHCGLDEHTHTDTCKDSAGGIVCGSNEHIHTSVCLVDLSDLDTDASEKVRYVISLIDDIPSADELMAKSEELAEAGDMDAEEQWLTEVYQKIGLAYSQYVGLSEDLQNRVINRDKLLELEFVWSQMPLATYYVWLDGTNGGMMSLYGSDNTLQTLTTWQNSYQYTLPTTWKSPAKYSYTLRGWYDIYGRNYYRPGETVNITRNTVFYADWEAANYNIGQFNANVVDTVSTNDFVTTRMFDYSGIFNMYSSSLHSNHVRQDSHAESWNAIAKGVQLSDGVPSLGIILRDWDTNGSKQLSYPSNFNDTSYPQFNTSDYVTSGLYYSYNMYDLFFNPNSHYMGKEYLGTADHLFQYEKDPNSRYYGYYYYDSARNAASYNQSTGRFYVYDYLERTTTSKDNEKDSDFLPFNSPYVNNPQNHGPTPETSSSGQRIYTYSSTDGNSNMTGTNFWFGMSTEIRFYLPNTPGDRDESGHYGNQSLYGQDMEFRFSGDDDVYVLVDNYLILDIGGIHDIKSGTINFSTGVVTVEGAEQTDKSAILKGLPSGEHTLTLLYMERGSSMSNCSVYFNISPRFTLSIQKEDLLSNALLDGAEFQVFMDENCEDPAVLWPSYQEYLNHKDKTTNVITVDDGYSSLWGFAAGNTYYIKETKPPEGQGYLIPNGLIKMELSNKGVASYTAMVIPDPNATGDADNPSPGFQVEGFRIDEENHVAYLIVNNSSAEGETTDVLVRKTWEGTEGPPITVYLLADGERIQNVTLSDENNWRYQWENLPMYRLITSSENETPKLTEIVYTVEEGVIPGYVGTIEPLTESTVTSVSWKEVSDFTTNETYLLYTDHGCLATTSNGGLAWVSEETAKASPSAQWKVISYNGTAVSLKNEDGYYLCNQWVGYGEGESYFYGSKNPGSVDFIDNRFREQGNNQRYLHSTINSSGHILAYYDGYHAVQFTLHQRIGQVSTEKFDGVGFKITNKPITTENLTSLTVTKFWTERDGQTPFQNQSLYETANVSVKLQANGVDTGQTAKLNLKSQWKYTFSGLPLKDSSGKTIDYTVVETWNNEDWRPQYSEVVAEADGSFSVRITNVYDHRISIPVEKRWDTTIHNIEKESVQIQLYAASGDNMEGVLVDSINLTAETDWKGILKAIPPDVENVEYYIYEQTELFAPEYGVPARIFINGVSRRVNRVVFDSVTGEAETSLVTNRPLLELPETGGTELLLYTAGGMLTTTAAVQLLYQKRSKRRRREEDTSDA